MKHTNLNFMATNMAKNSPPVMAALQKNIFEHISLMAQEQLEVEFREEIQQLMQLQQVAQMNPAMGQSPEIQQQIMQLSMAIEARKAKLEKTILGKTLPNSDQMMPNVAIIRKTGE